MKAFLNALAVALLSSSLFPMTVMAQQPASILGKTDLHSLLNFTPTMPANTADAAIRAYGTNSQPQSLLSNLDSVAEYQAWRKQNLGRINTLTFDSLLSNNTELVVIGCEDALISMMGDLAKYNKDVTLAASRYERDYQDKVRGSNASVMGTSKSHS